MRFPDASLVGAFTTIRSATPDDVDLLIAWHADPEVARYWDGKTFTREQMVLRLARPNVDPYIVVHDGEPVGYLQVWFEEASPEHGGIDMFLIPAARGRGLGPDAARTVAHWLMDARGLRRLTVDPYLSNRRAIAAWRKAGFQPVKECEPDDEHAVPWLLMLFDAGEKSYTARSPCGAGLPARLDFPRSGEDDPPMNERPSAGSGVVGYMLVLVGVAGFVLSCFLPSTRFFDQVSVSYYQLVTGSRGGTLEDVGGLLLLFGGTTTVAWVALAGLRHGQHERRRTPSTLLAVTIAWSLSWIGLLLSLSGPFEHEVGYWSMLVSVGVVIVGSVVAWVSGRRTAHGLDSGAGPEPPTEVPVS